MERPRFKAKHIIFLTCTLAALSCATPQQIVGDSSELLQLQQSAPVVLGEKVTFPEPLPNYYPIYRKGQPDHLMAKGWDMDKDGHLDKIDVLGLEGEIIESYFDFDRDGTVDHREIFGKDVQIPAKTL